jgi:hypothetical protein
MQRLSSWRVVGCFLVVSALSPAAQAATRQWVAPDFFVDTGAIAELSGLLRDTRGRRVSDCRANIRAVTCVSRGVFDAAGDVPMTRGCARGAEPYVAFFERVYDRLEPTLQKMFCSVKAIHVEPNLESIAYAGMSFRGAEIGFRKSIIDEGLDLSRLISWKEQLPFGGVRGSYEVARDLPQVEIVSDAPPVEDLAFYVLSHEFGHLFDFANDINGGRRDGWTPLSWESRGTPLPTSDFPHRADICYYNCSGGPLDRGVIPALYAGLERSNFVTVYAATNPYDDWAESLAFYMLEQQGMTYDLRTGQGETYDLLSKLRAPQFASKLAWVERFLAGTLQYP